MRIYSDFALRRAFEIVGDLVAVAIIAVGVSAAIALHASIAAVGEVGRQLRESGSGFAGTMSDIGTNLSGIPLIGGGIAAPFDGAAGAGQTLADAGSDFQSGMELVATIVGWTLAVLVVLIVVLGWIGPRTLATVRRTRLGRLAASAPSRDLLAFRALANRPARALARIDDPVGGWRRGDPSTVSALAALELHASGVRLRTPTASKLPGTS